VSGPRAAARATAERTLGGAAARRVRLLRAVGRERPRPHPRIETGPSVPVGFLRVLQAIVGLGCTAVVATSDVQWLFTVLALVAGLVWPAPLWLAVLPLSWGAGLAALPLGPISAEAPLLLAGLHLYVVLGTAAGRMPPAGRVEWAALAPTAVRFVALQATAQLVGWAAGMLRERDVAAPGVAIVAAALLAAAAWWAAGHLQRADAGDQPGRRPARGEDREPNRGDDGWSYHLDA